MHLQKKDYFYTFGDDQMHFELINNETNIKLDLRKKNKKRIKSKLFLIQTN